MKKGDDGRWYLADVDAFAEYIDRRNKQHHGRRGPRTLARVDDAPLANLLVQGRSGLDGFARMLPEAHHRVSCDVRIRGRRCSR